MLLMMLIGQAAASDASRIMAETRALTRATVDCDAKRTGNDILVCAARDADRWRVPFLTPEAGDPAIEDVHAERERLIARPNNCAEMRLMAYGCGMAGVSATTRGQGVELETPRPLAP